MPRFSSSLPYILQQLNSLRREKTSTQTLLDLEFEFAQSAWGRRGLFVGEHKGPFRLGLVRRRVERLPCLLLRRTARMSSTFMMPWGQCFCSRSHGLFWWKAYFGAIMGAGTLYHFPCDGSNNEILTSSMSPLSFHLSACQRLAAHNFLLQK